MPTSPRPFFGPTATRSGGPYSPRLRGLMPQLLTQDLRKYRPDGRSGPAIWLRCVIDRVLDSPRLTSFPDGPDFDGNRRNDLHYTNAMKGVAGERERERAWDAVPGAHRVTTPLFTESELRDLVSRDEGQFLEFKSTWDRSDDIPKQVKRRAIRDAIAETVAAFANADGGLLLVGIEDDGSPTGHDYPDEVIDDFVSVPRRRVETVRLVSCRPVEDSRGRSTGVQRSNRS